jgi:hypothetical protein
MIDLAICLECTSSMASYLNRVRKMIIAILINISALNPNAIHTSVIQFRSRARHDPWSTNTYAPTQNIDMLREWLDKVEAFGGSEDECEAIGKRKCFIVKQIFFYGCLLLIVSVFMCV